MKSECRNPNNSANQRSFRGLRSGRYSSVFGILSDFGIREAIAKVAPLWYSHALFPLIPALSPREREHHRQRIREPGPFGVVAAWSLVLPLPEGEGRGEGERALESAVLLCPVPL